MDLSKYFTTSDEFYNNGSIDYYPILEATRIHRVNSAYNGSDSENQTRADLTKFCLTYKCIPNAILLSIISVCGILANLAVMIAVKVDKRLHQATFVTIFALALSDCTFLVARYTRYIFDSYLSTKIQREVYMSINTMCDFIGLTGAGASVFHLIFLSVLRYFVIVYPMKSHVILTTKLVMLISILLWIVAFCNSGFYLYAVIINQTNANLRQNTNFVLTLLMSVSPVLVIGVLHAVKARVLMTSLSSTEKSKRKMSVVVTIVIISYLITTTPINVIDIARLFLSDEHTKTSWFFNFQMGARILLFLNYAINPFIYFIFSPQFKRFFSEHCSLKRQYPKRRLNTGSQNEQDQSTQLLNISSKKSSN